MFSVSKIFKVFFLSGLFALFIFSNAFPVLAAGEMANTIKGLGETYKAGYGVLPSSEPVDFYKKAGSILGIALSFIGIIFLGLMIYAGFTWMMARGNQQDADKAKELIQQAVIGLAIVLSAYVITKFVGEILTKSATGA